MISDKLKKYKLAYNKFLKECKNSKSKKCKKLSKSLKRSLRKSRRRSKSRVRSRRRSRRRSHRRNDGVWTYLLPVNSVNVVNRGGVVQKYQGGNASFTCNNDFTYNNLENIDCRV